MPRGIMFAACLILGLSACRHPDGTNTSGDDGVSPGQGASEADPDLPDLPAKQAWTQGGKSFTVHRSATCPSNSIEDSGCGNETTYRFVRATRLLKLSVCTCGNDRSEEKQLTLSHAQVQEIDQWMNALETVTGPQVTCTGADSGNLWELIVENPETVEQSYPVQLCKSSAKQNGKINPRAFQTLYEYLKKTLP